MREVRDAGATKGVVLSQYIASLVLTRSQLLARKAKNAGEIADYLQWIKGHFDSTSTVASRESLWTRMSAEVHNSIAHGVEFGVAWGYLTNWWLLECPSSNLRWDGFDRFTGLPRAWRDMEEGAFSANGIPPNLEDDRVTWHVGDVEDTIQELDLTSSEAEKLIIFFDLDIYEPSKIAWQQIHSHLKPGDMLYFDEAFDRDERRLLDEDVLPNFEFDLIGNTPLALALRVK